MKVRIENELNEVAYEGNIEHALGAGDAIKCKGEVLFITYTEYDIDNNEMLIKTRRKER